MQFGVLIDVKLIQTVNASDPISVHIGKSTVWSDLQYWNTHDPKETHDGNIASWKRQLLNAYAPTFCNIGTEIRLILVQHAKASLCIVWHAGRSISWILHELNAELPITSHFGKDIEDNELQDKKTSVPIVLHAGKSMLVKDEQFKNADDDIFKQLGATIWDKAVHSLKHFKGIVSKTGKLAFLKDVQLSKTEAPTDVQHGRFILINPVWENAPLDIVSHFCNRISDKDEQNAKAELCIDIHLLRFAAVRASHP